MSSTRVARLVLAATLLCPIAGVLAVPAAAEPPTTPCVSAGEIDDPLAPPDAPTTSCDSQKQACMSASVQIGIYGERYVPPDAVAQCMEAYRDCIGRQSSDGGQG